MERITNSCVSLKVGNANRNQIQVDFQGAFVTLVYLLLFSP